MNRRATPRRLTAGRTEPWRPTPAHFRAGVCAVVLLSVAVFARRPDLLVIGTPFAIVTVWSALTRPTQMPAFGDRLGRSTLREGEAVAWRSHVSEVDHLDVASASVADMTYMQRVPAQGSVVVDARGGGDLEIGLRTIRWGRRHLEPLELVAASSWGAFRCSSQLDPQATRTLPLPAAFDVRVPPRPTDGLVGTHRAARPGEGSEFHAVRDFQLGDRMRRINWARSSRAESLQVNATFADQDTHVALVIDSVEDLGISEGIEGRSSSLDITVRAAGAIAETYARRGDRVSLDSFDPLVRLSISPSSGEQHLRRLLDVLARINAPLARTTSAPGHWARSADVVIVLSALIVPGSLDRAVELARSGRSVVVVDTLPEGVEEADDELLTLAWRIRLLERDREVRQARSNGVAVVPWAGPGSLDSVLREIGRRASAPRATVR